MKSVSCKTVFLMGQCYMHNCTSLTILPCLQCSTICSAQRFGYNNCTARFHLASGSWESESVFELIFLLSYNWEGDVLGRVLKEGPSGHLSQTIPRHLLLSFGCWAHLPDCVRYSCLCIVIIAAQVRLFPSMFFPFKGTVQRKLRWVKSRTNR